MMVGVSVSMLQYVSIGPRNMLMELTCRFVGDLSDFRAELIFNLVRDGL